jgi:hypothetical protein
VYAVDPQSGSHKHYADILNVLNFCSELYIGPDIYWPNIQNRTIYRLENSACATVDTFNFQQVQEQYLSQGGQLGFADPTAFSGSLSDLANLGAGFAKDTRRLLT